MAKASLTLTARFGLGVNAAPGRNVGAIFDLENLRLFDRPSRNAIGHSRSGIEGGITA